MMKCNNIFLECQKSFHSFQWQALKYINFHVNHDLREVIAKSVI